jgi:hypothetical protein
MPCQSINILYALEHEFLALWSLSLFYYSIRQYHLDNKISIISRISQLGRTRLILHRVCLIGSIILVIRSVDPIPILGIYPFVVIDILSQTNTAILVSGVLISLQTLVSSTYGRSHLDVPYYFQIMSNILAILITLAAISTACIAEWITRQSIYSDGIYMCVLTIGDLVFLIFFWMVIQRFEKKVKMLSIQKDVVALDNQYEYIDTLQKKNSKDRMECIRKVDRGDRRLKILFWYTTGIFILILLAQGWKLYNIFTTNYIIEDEDPEKFNPIACMFMILQNIAISVILFFFPTPKSKLLRPISDISGTDFCTEISVVNLK